MDQLRNTFKINKRKYAWAVTHCRLELGSFEAIAAQCYAHNGKSVSGNAIRRWFNDQSLPVEYAAVMADLTLGQVSVLDFYPWLSEYTRPYP